MANNRKNEPIRSWEAGDTVAGFAYLAKKERRQDRNGNDYLDLELADASGAINGKAWSDSQALGRELEAGDFVAFKGQVTSYNNRLQVSVKDCRRVTDEDTARGLDVARLIPSASEDVDVLWERLTGVLETSLTRPEAKRLAAETLEAYGEALREHPAAKGFHHAYRGGLLEHVASMAQVANLLCDHYRELDRDQLLLGVLYHDIGKLRELEPMPSKEYTEEGRLVGHVVIGYQMLRERCAAIPDFPAELRRRLEHLVLSHQGLKEYGSPVEPATAEALALNYVDDLDAKLSMLRRAREEGLEGRQWVDALRRFVFLDALEEKLEESPRDEEPAATSEQSRLEL